jgi:hypothetical protein
MANFCGMGDHQACEVEGYCRHGNGRLVPCNIGKFLSINGWQLLKEDSAWLNELLFTLSETCLTIHSWWQFESLCSTALYWRNLKMCRIMLQLIVLLWYGVKSYPHNRLWRSIGLWDVKDPTLYRQSAHKWWQGCQPYIPAALNSSETLFLCFWYSFLLQVELTPGPSVAGRIR